MFKTKLYAMLAMLGIVALLAVACNGELPASFPPAPSPAPAPSAAPEANFRFLISDEVNAIDKFASLNVTISKIGVHSRGESANWTEFTPDIPVVDLKTVMDEKAIEIWNGHLTPGEYTKVFIYVSAVNGTLTDEFGGGRPDIKLPSGKLQISRPFIISDDATTSFVYDVTVIEAGKSGRFNLQPQVAQSGTGIKFTEVKQDRDRDRDRDRDGVVVSLEDTLWKLESYGPSDNLTDVLEGTEITITFVNADGTFNGTAGCNHYFGSYAFDGSTLTTSAIGSTEMACDPPIMDQEQAYLSILSDAATFEIDGNDLTIVCGAGVLNFEKD
jgi:heat shock protein HslJ